MVSRKSKSRPQWKARRRARVFLLVVIVGGLAAAAIWAWHRAGPPPVTSNYQEAGWMPRQPSDRWRCIVIHHSAAETGGADRFDTFHRARGWDGLGYHFVIGNGSDTNDGEVEIGPRWVEQRHGAHCKTDDNFYNEHGIGICLVGNFNNHPPDARQMQSLVRLTRFLCARFRIPVSSILTHGGVTGKTECPGSQFDLAELKRRVRRGEREG